jgi:Tol biopolymer transport system component
VAFASEATNLVAGDGNEESDVFVHDRATGRTVRVSVRATGGREGNGPSWDPSISGDGSRIAFTSLARNLDPRDQDGPGVSDVFVHDRGTGTTRMVSLSSSGEDGSGMEPSLSQNGRWVAFDSPSKLDRPDRNQNRDIFTHDLKTRTTRRISERPNGREAKGGSRNSVISPTGRYVAFESHALNLAGGPGYWGTRNILLWDRRTERTRLISVNLDGDPLDGENGGIQPAVTSNGRFVAFTSDEDDLVEGDTSGFLDIFVRGPLG